MEHRLVVRFFRAKQVEDDARELVCGCCNCLRLAKLASYPSKEFAQIIFGVMQRVRTHTQGGSDSAPNTSAFRVQHLASTDLLFGA